VNEDQIITLVLGAILNGIMLALGMWIGTRQSAKAIVKEIEAMLERSTVMKSVKGMVTKRNAKKITKFLDEATKLVSSPEAKNFFKNVTELMKQLEEEPDVKVKLPEKEGVKKNGS